MDLIDASGDLRDACQSAACALRRTCHASELRATFERDIVTFAGEALGHRVSCAISREALDDNFGPTTGLSNEQRLEKYRKNRNVIERMATEKYLNWPIEEPETVLIKTVDVPKLQSKVVK